MEQRQRWEDAAESAARETELARHAAQIATDGFAIMSGIYSTIEIDTIIAQLDSCLRDDAAGAAVIQTQTRTVYAARNVLDWFPAADRVWRCEPVLHLLRDVLGHQAGLVRVLYFDKPPDRTWSLPWHKDLTISVKDHGLPESQGLGPFRNPTTKAGVHHVEAPTEILENMLTLRLHLDDVDETNGPLSVLAGSHHAGKSPGDQGTVHQVLASRGEMLAMRPLVAHSSRASLPGTPRHRRILHFEFSADPVLPAGFEWHTFSPV